MRIIETIAQKQLYYIASTSYAKPNWIFLCSKNVPNPFLKLELTRNIMCANALKNKLILK